jgi:hypothetical protein
MDHPSKGVAAMSESAQPSLNSSESLSLAVRDPSVLRDLVDRFPAEDILETLRKHGVVELCNYNDHTIPVSLGALIEDRCKLSAAVEMLRHHELRQVFSCLEEAGMQDLIVFKGTALAYSVYADPWRRPRADTDLLIDRKNLPDIVQALKKIDYKLQPGIRGRLVSSQVMLSKDFNDHTQHTLDIHWRLSNRHSLAGCFDLDSLLSRATPLKELSKIAMAPCALDAVLLAALHLVGHRGAAELGVRGVA